MGRTKQAASCPRLRPAFISVGEFGKNHIRLNMFRNVFFCFFNIGGGVKNCIRSGNAAGDPGEQFLRGLDDVPFGVFFQIPFFQNYFSIF